MCIRLKHFPTHHNARTSLTPAVISKFKAHEMRQRPPGPRWRELTTLPETLDLTGLGGGERDKEGWELEEEEKRERRGGEGGGKGRDPTKSREKLTPLARYQKSVVDELKGFVGLAYNVACCLYAEICMGRVHASMAWVALGRDF